MNFFNRQQIVITITFCLLCSANLNAGLKVFYVRHAESGANVEKKWEKQPKDTWPEYVGNADAFSDKGKEQLQPLVEKLKKYKFDHIFVSPKWRTRNTILPYLKATSQKAIIWPELIEGPGGASIASTKTKLPTEDIFNKGEPIEIPADENAFFSLREDGTNYYLAPEHGKSKDKHISCMRAASLRTIKLLKEKYADQDKNVLLIGHGSAGKGLLLNLTTNGKKAKGQMKNSSLWIAEEQSNGSFKLTMYNDKKIK